MVGVDLAGAAHLELVSGVVQLRAEDAMVEAMLRGWRVSRPPAICKLRHEHRSNT